MMRSYLLGRLPERDAEEIERRYFEDDLALAALEAAEHDLMDDLAAGRLSPEDRAACEDHFLASPGRRERLRVARMLARSLSGRQAADAPRAVHPGVLAAAAPWSLQLGALRDAAARPVVALPAGPEPVRVELQSDRADRFPSFLVRILTAEGAVAEEVRDARLDPDRGVLTFHLEPTRLGIGIHRLELSGIAPGSEPRALGGVDFEIR